MDEIWKPVTGYEGLYDVSNLGRVISYVKYPKGKMMKPSISKWKRTNYPRVMLCKGNRQKITYVHRIVWVTFVGEIPKGYELNHIDSNKENPRLDNLELVTRQGNMRHAADNGLITFVYDFDNGKCKIDRATKNLIKELYKSGQATTLELASRYGVSRGHIYHIINGRR